MQVLCQYASVRLSWSLATTRSRSGCQCSFASTVDSFSLGLVVSPVLGPGRSDIRAVASRPCSPSPPLPDLWPLPPGLRAVASRSSIRRLPVFGPCPPGRLSDVSQSSVHCLLSVCPSPPGHLSIAFPLYARRHPVLGPSPAGRLAVASGSSVLEPSPLNIILIT